MFPQSLLLGEPYRSFPGERQNVDFAPAAACLRCFPFLKTPGGNPQPFRPFPPPPTPSSPILPLCRWRTPIRASSAQVHPRRRITSPLSPGPAPTPPKLVKAFWDRSVSFNVDATTANAGGTNGGCCIPSSTGSAVVREDPSSIGIEIDLDGVVASSPSNVRRSVPDKILDLLVRSHVARP